MDLVLSNLSGVPIQGSVLITLILGGGGPDEVPLYRGYALQIWFLPVVLSLWLALHFLIAWKQGLHDLPTIWRRFRAKYPRVTAVHLLQGLGLLIALLIVSWLTPSDDLASPADRSPWPHPDWLLAFYVLPFWFFQGGSRILGAVVLPLGLLRYLALSPQILKKIARPA